MQLARRNSDKGGRLMQAEKLKKKKIQRNSAFTLHNIKTNHIQIRFDYVLSACTHIDQSRRPVVSE